MKTIENYSDELLLNRWQEERELLLDLGDLLSDFRGSEKRKKELTEDHERHSGYIARMRAEMANRNMFSDDGSLKPEYKKLLMR